jgi:hypothetical protein
VVSRNEISWTKLENDMIVQEDLGVGEFGSSFEGELGVDI